MTQPGGPASLTLRLKHAEQAVRRRLQPALRRDDVSFEHWQVLSALLEQPGQRMTELAEAAALPAATLTRHVDRLVERALVIRRTDTADKRRIVVALSQRGAQIALRLRTVELDVEADVTLPRLR